MNYGHILTKFLDTYKGKKVNFIISNGFQLKGRLIDYDTTHVLLETEAYGHCKLVPVTISSINTFVPNEN